MEFLDKVKNGMKQPQPDNWRANMKQEEAKRMILDEWYKLPPEERRTEHQATVFALRQASLVTFKYSGDPYQHIMAWLSKHRP